MTGSGAAALHWSFARFSFPSSCQKVRGEARRGCEYPAEGSEAGASSGGEAMRQVERIRPLKPCR